MHAGLGKQFRNKEAGGSNSPQPTLCISSTLALCETCLPRALGTLRVISGILRVLRVVFGLVTMPVKTRAPSHRARVLPKTATSPLRRPPRQRGAVFALFYLADRCARRPSRARAVRDCRGARRLRSSPTSGRPASTRCLDDHRDAALVRVATSFRFACQRRSGWRTGGSDLISTPRFSSQPHVEGFSRRGHVGMKIEATAAQGANPAPLAHQSHVAE